MMFSRLHFISRVQNLELLGNSCAIKAFLYRGQNTIKNTKLELNVQEKFSEQVYLNWKIKLSLLKDQKIFWEASCKLGRANW